MPQEKCEAVLLRGVDFSETSRIITFLTPVHGRLACLAKGVRRKNSPFAGLLDTFNHVELVYYWKEGREVQNLAEISLIHGFGGLKRDMEKSAYAAFPLELAAKCAHADESAAELFQELLRGLHGLENWRGAPVWHTCWQVDALMNVLGFAPELDMCVNSGKAVEGACRFSWEGGVCVEGPAQARLGAATLAAMRAMREAAGECPGLGGEAEARAGREIFTLLRNYAAHQAECDFRSVRVIEQMLNV